MAKTVLIVDDDPATRRAVEGALKVEGIEARTAENGAQCLLAVKEDAPDLVILDVNMPVMDGLQALRAIRQDTATRHLPVIMLTVRDDDDDVARGWVTGVDFYLTKPFDLQDLLAAVRRALDVTGKPGEDSA